MPKSIPRAEELIDAEEGHVTAVARMVERARAAPPSDDVVRDFVDPRKTALSGWRFEGYMPGTARHQVERVFSRDGSVLIFEQWNMAADGASILSAPQPTETVGRFPATRDGLRTPSGCVSASLHWHGDGMSYSLKVAGPLSYEEQRILLMDLARSIEAATSTLRL